MVPQKVKQLSKDLAILPQRIKPGIQKNTCEPMFTVALFTIGKRWKQPKYPSMDEWTNKMQHTHTMEFYL